MNTEGYKPFSIDRFGSYVKTDDPRQMPFSVSLLANDWRYELRSGGTRYGIWRTIEATKAVKSLGMILYRAAVESAILLYNTEVGLFKETDAAGVGVQLDNGGGFIPGNLVPTPDCFMQIEETFNRAYIAMGDLRQGTALPAVYDPSRDKLEPLSMKVVGDIVARNTQYYIGEVVTPTVANGHLYRCTTEGITAGAEPAYSLVAASANADGTAVFTEMTPAMATSAAAGNICVGTRWMVVLYFNANGYLTGMSERVPVSVNLVTGSRQVDVSNIWVGPANTAKRVCAFTVAGGASVGEFFYLPEDDIVSGVTMTQTVIEDNITTTASFNFTDDYLVTGMSVDDQFRIQQIPAVSDVYFAKKLAMMVYTGAASFRSGHIISRGNDVEAWFADTGIVQVNENDGQMTVTWRELKGTHLSFKEHSFHAVGVSAAPPSQWSVDERSTEVGLFGPRAIDVATNDFMILAHDTGAYRYDNENLIPISPEIEDDWLRINKEYKHLVWVKIDTDHQEILIGAPLDEATAPSHVFRMSYKEGWGNPLVRTRTKVGQRKWSLDTIEAYHAVKTRSRTLAAPPDPDIADSQLLFGSANDAEGVGMQIPGVYSDKWNGVDETAIPWAVETAFGPEGSLGEWRSKGFTLLGRGDAGNARLIVTHKYNRSATAPAVYSQVLRPLIMNDDGFVEDRQYEKVNEGFKLRVENGDGEGLPQVGAWVELHKITFWLAPWSTTRL